MLQCSAFTCASRRASTLVGQSPDPDATARAAWGVGRLARGVGRLPRGVAPVAREGLRRSAFTSASRDASSRLSAPTSSSASAAVAYRKGEKSKIKR